MTAAETAGQDGALPSPAPQQVTVLSQLVARPGRESVVCDALLRLVGPARAEPGNLGYDVHRLKTSPGVFYVLANWADQAAFDAHMATAEVRAMLSDREPDLVAPPVLSYARPLSAPPPDGGRRRPRAGSPAQVTLVPFFTVKPTEVIAVARAHLAMVEPTRAEPGCLGYDLYQSREQPTVLFFYENWTDQDALDAHLNTAAFHRYVRGEVDPRLAVPWAAHTMTMLSSPGGP
ncbi:putative quinol monooxygenase [Rhizomonospora bruguierae]|uniref:putative quinol monooxygenase n=1 Tax=Rhizomonospora bruguierae TaxID=1581705 RepID=UPI001BCCD298|nr:putative quinol monooxygenase [Micromonospora sp. NBRC 107566]